MNSLVTAAHLAVFKQAIERLHPIPEADFDLLAGVLHFKNYTKSENVLKEGEVCKNIWFIIKGGFRIYSMEDNHEVNIGFFFENTIACDFISVRHDIPSNFFIEALEDTETLISYKRDYMPVINFSLPLMQLTFRFFQERYFGEVEHSNSFKLLNPEERYKQLLNKHPKYFQRIPLTHLASYMGISRKTLTRIRSNIA